MPVFESVFTVEEKHLDDIQHVNNVHYVQWVQDIAKLHWDRNATPSIQERYFWVLTTHLIEYKNSALLGDLINVRTYVSKYQGAVCHRIVEITDKTTNMLLATSETKWCLISTETKRPTRITREIAELFE